MPATAAIRRLPSPERAVLERAIMDAVKALANFHPTEIIGMRPDAADASNLADDVHTIADIADSLIYAIGTYASSHISIDKKVLAENFGSVCRDAVDDSAGYLLRGIASQYEADARSDGQRHDFQRSARA